MAGAGAGAQTAMQGLSCAPHLQQQNWSPCPTEAMVLVCGQCHGTMWCLARVTQRHEYRMNTGHFSCGRQPRAVHTPSCQDTPLPCHKGISSLVFHPSGGNVPARDMPAGTGAGCAVMGTLAAMNQLFSPCQARLLVSFSPSKVPGAAPRSGLGCSMQGR